MPIRWIFLGFIPKTQRRGHVSTSVLLAVRCAASLIPNWFASGDGRKVSRVDSVENVLLLAVALCAQQDAVDEYEFVRFLGRSTEPTKTAGTTHFNTVSRHRKNNCAPIHSFLAQTPVPSQSRAVGHTSNQVDTIVRQTMNHSDEPRRDTSIKTLCTPK